MRQLLVKNKHGKVMAVVEIDEQLTIEVPNVAFQDNNSTYNVAKQDMYVDGTKIITIKESDTTMAFLRGKSSEARK